MCGFVGRILCGPAQQLIEQAAPALSGRGPDGWRSWRSPCGRVELLHARLAIVDPDARAMQPFALADSGHVMAFNGEVYNYLALRAQLRQHHFVTESDTEVLLAGLHLHGADFLRQVQGMVSGVWVDLEQQRIRLFRDSVGKKPLLIWQDSDGSLLFGSSLRALCALRKQPGEIRPDALKEVLSQGYLELPAGLYQGVRHLAPGEILTFDLEAQEIQRSKIISVGSHRFEGEPAEEVDRLVGRLLEQAVSLRLENNPAPAALFSGGIDSTLVAGTAARLLRARGQSLTIYSLKPFIPFTNDQPYAKQAAQQLDLDIRWVSFPAGRTPDRLLAAIDGMDEPLALPAFFYLWDLVRAVRQDSRVLLTGDGGDEAFCGYGVDSDWRQKGHEGPSGLQVGPALPDWFGAWAQRCVSGDLFGHGFQKVDRASAEQGVEIRCPLLDQQLLHYARSLPEQQLLRAGRMKALLKAQLSGWPAGFLDRRKMGMTYNLRWQWALSNFAGLREQIDPQLIDALGEQLPSRLCQAPKNWGLRTIFQHFSQAFALLVLSRVMGNLKVSELAARNPQKR